MQIGKTGTQHDILFDNSVEKVKYPPSLGKSGLLTHEDHMNNMARLHMYFKSMRMSILESLGIPESYLSFRVRRPGTASHLRYWNGSEIFITGVEVIPTRVSSNSIQLRVLDQIDQCMKGGDQAGTRGRNKHLEKPLRKCSST